MSPVEAALDFRRRKIKVEQVVAEATESRTITATLTVPQAKPDVDKVLSARELPTITRVTVIRNGVVIEGTLQIEVMYVAALPGQPVHTFEATIPFTEFVSLPGVFPGMIPEVSVTVEFASYRIVTPRSVEANIILTFRVKVVTEEVVELAVEVPKVILPRVKIEKKVVKVERILLEGQAKAVVTGKIVVPAGQPGATRIVHVDAASRVTDVDVIPGKVIVDGLLRVRVLYVGNLPSQPVFAVDDTLHFTTFVQLDGVDPGMFAYARSRVEHISVDILDPRTLQVRAIVKVSVLVTVERPIEFISRIEELMPPPVVITREFLVEEVVFEREETSVIKLSLPLPPGNPGILRVVEADARAVVKEVLAISDAVLVKGNLRVDVLYVADLPGQPVYAVQDVAPFLVKVMAPGVLPGMFATADVDVERVTASATSPRLLDVRVVVRAWVLVTSVARVPAVIGPQDPNAQVLGSGEDSQAGKVEGRVHVVKPRDTLWQIARSYGVSVEAIARANDLRDPDTLNVGEILVIPPT